jgi:hypothetical protein
LPQELVTEELAADKWMATLVEGLEHGTFSSPRGQDPRLVVNLKRVRVPTSDIQILKGMEKAREYISSQILVKTPSDTRQIEVDS